MDHTRDTREVEHRDLGTWAFLRPGWWVVHLVGVAVIVWMAVQLFAY